VRRGEQPREAARRELREELGLEVGPDDLVLVREMVVDCDFRRDHVRIFEFRPHEEPVLRIDNREIVAAASWSRGRSWPKQSCRRSSARTWAEGILTASARQPGPDAQAARRGAARRHPRRSPPRAPPAAATGNAAVEQPGRGGERAGAGSSERRGPPGGPARARAVAPTSWPPSRAVPASRAGP
jgi:ADP-ribose pyrophosphatase YjhB (NUDIX family)